MEDQQNRPEAARRRAGCANRMRRVRRRWTYRESEHKEALAEVDFFNP